MIVVDTVYKLHTGNLFGVYPGWIETFYRTAQEIGEGHLGENEYQICPAAAAAWCEVFDKEVASRIQRRWNQLLPLAIHSAPCKKYREEMIQEHLARAEGP